MEPDAQRAPPRTEGAPRLPRLRLALPAARLQGAVALSLHTVPPCLRTSTLLPSATPLRASVSRYAPPARCSRPLPGVVARDAAAALRLPRQGGSEPEPQLGRPAGPAPGGRCAARRGSDDGRGRGRGGVPLDLHAQLPARAHARRAWDEHGARERPGQRPGASVRAAAAPPEDQPHRLRAQGAPGPPLPAYLYQPTPSCDREPDPHPEPHPNPGSY